MDDLSYEEKDAIMQRVFFLALTGVYRGFGKFHYLEVAYFVRSQIGEIKNLYEFEKVLQLLKDNGLASVREENLFGKKGMIIKRWTITEKGLEALQIV